MGRLILQTSMTVDALVSVSDWYVSEGGQDAASRDFIAGSEGLVVGRKTYEGLAGYRTEQEGPWGVDLRLRLLGAEGFDSGVTLLRYEL